MTKKPKDIQAPVANEPEANEPEANEPEANEPEANEPEALTEIQQTIKDALNAEDHIGALKELQAKSDERLSTIIATFIALSTALGDDAPATQHALNNLQNYTPIALKVAKATKEPTFNENKVLSTALSAENSIDALKALSIDARISKPLNVAIVTYLTLVDIEGIDENVVTSAKATLQTFGKKAGSRKSPTREQFHIKDSKGNIYTTLTGALDGNGIKKGTIVEVDGKQRDAQDIAWRTTRTKLLADGVAEYKGVNYTKVTVSANAITSSNKAKPADTDKGAE